MLHFYLDSPSFAGKNLVSIHDACTSLYLLYPDLFQGEYVQVSVHCDEDETRGETICTPCPAQDEHAILKLNQTDLQQFQKTLLEQIAALG